MPVLPISDFWSNSFVKYYKLRWVHQEDMWVDARNSKKKHAEQSVENEDKHPYVNAFLAKYNVPFIIMAALLIYIVVLLIPLSVNTSFTSDKRNSNPQLYVTYQTIYTMLAYPCTVQIFYAALPTTLKSKFYRYFVIPIPIFLIITVIYILYSPLVPGVKTQKQYSRTLGPFILSFYATIVFFIVAYAKTCKRWLVKNVIKPEFENKGIDANHERRYTNMTHPFSKNSGRHSISFSMTPTKYSTFNNDTINSAILFQNSELSEDSNLGEKTMSYVDNEQLQAIACLFTVGGITTAYYWTQYITWQWEKYNTNDVIPKTFSQEINSILLLYPTFWFVMNLIQFITARCARFCDSNKTSVYSLEIIITFFVSCFYYVFYRNLFLHIGSVRDFLFVKTLHIGLELLTNVCRMSWWYFANTRKLQAKLHDSKMFCARLLWPLFRIIYDPSEYHIWCVRICIGYTITFIVCVGSAISYIVGVLWLRYGYNQYFYDIQNVNTIQFEKTLIFTGVGIGIELLMYFLIDKMMTYVYQIDVVKHWKVLMEHRSGYIWYFIFILQHVQTDCMIAKLINV